MRCAGDYGSDGNRDGNHDFDGLVDVPISDNMLGGE